MKRALVIGSISYDKIFSIDGFVEQGIIIKDNKVEELDLTFRAEEPTIQYGGTGGNIAYGLGLLKANPLLTGIVGEDFHYDYKKHLDKHKIETNVFTKELSSTATFYGIEDKAHKTISIWQPNAASYVTELNLKEILKPEAIKDIEVVIVSPSGKPEAFSKFLHESRELFPEALLIFDPGQDLSYIEDNVLVESLESADIVIVNEVELEQLKTKLKAEVENIFDYDIDALIETKGADGSVIYFPEMKKTEVSSCKADNVIQVTGAGDAFRAGLIYGILKGEKIADACKFGSVMGSFAVENWGGQGYKITPADFEKRYKINYSKTK